MVVIAVLANNQPLQAKTLYVENDDIQVSQEIASSPMTGSQVIYTKNKIDASLDTDNHNAVKQVAQPSLGKPSSHSQVSAQREMAPEKQEQFGKATTPDQTANVLETPVTQPSLNQALTVLPHRVTKSANFTPEAVKLLEQIKAKQKQKQQMAELNRDAELNLLPGEKLIQPNPKKKPSAIKKTKRSSKKRVAREELIIDKLEFTGANILDVARALADVSGLNFVATEKAAKKNVTVFLQNISVKHALETITKNSGLWYRKDKASGTYRIMSTDEYARDLIVYREDVTKVFKLLHPNPMLIATTIQDLYGRRVVLSYGMFDDTEMQLLQSGTGNSGVGRSNNSRGRSNRNNRGNNNNTGFNRANSAGGQNIKTIGETKTDFAKNITSELISNLEKDIDNASGQGVIGTDKLAGLTTSEQLIYVTLNREQDLLIVRTSDIPVMKDIEALVKALDLPTKQVLLEMKILSLDVGDFYRRAMDLDYMPSSDTLQGPLTDQAKNPLGTIAPLDVTSTNTVGGTTTTQSGVVNLGVSHILGLGNFALEGGTFVYQFLSDKIRARIQLLQQNNRIQTLSSPILLTTNKKPARVFVGTEQVVTTGFEAVTGTSNGLVATNPAIVPITEIRDIGNTLQVQPNINGDKTVTLLISQDASSLLRGGSTIPIPVGNTVQTFNADSVRTSNIQGTVVAKDGLTIAIGGLIDASDSEDIQKVPVIGDFPIIGEFFKRKVKEKSKRELILLITPHIIETPHESDDVSRDVVEPITEHEW